MLKRKQSSPQTSLDITLDDVDDVVDEEDWLQQVDAMCDQLSVQHPIYYDAYNLCDLHQKYKLGSFNVEMLKSICSHFESSFKARDIKHQLVEKLGAMITACSCAKSSSTEADTPTGQRL